MRTDSLDFSFQFLGIVFYIGRRTKLANFRRFHKLSTFLWYSFLELGPHFGIKFSFDFLS